MQKPGDNDLRVARNCVLDGKRIPAEVAAALEARGINVSDLERRLMDNMRFAS
jgi:hypothetical protein